MPSRSRQRFLATTATVSAGALTGCFSRSCSRRRTKHNTDISLPADARWPTQYYDAANTSYNPTADGPTGDVRLAWRYTTCRPSDVSVAVSDGSAYFGNLVISARTGKAANQWDDDDESTPIVVDGTAYIHSDDLEARDATTGKIEWTYPLASSNRPSPTVSDGTVYVAGNNLHAVHSETGEHRWTAETPTLGAPPAVGDGVVYSTDQNRTVHAVDTEAGEKRWSASATRPDGPAVPVAANGRVYFVASWETGQIQALDPADGSVVWTQTTEIQVSAPPAVTEERVFVVGENDEGGAVIALDAKTGQPQWEETRGSSRLVTVAASSETVYAGPQFAMDEPTIYALDQTTGESRWHFETRRRDFGDYDEATINGIVAADGHVFAATSGGEVHAITD